jgi:hypothetical protein
MDAQKKIKRFWEWFEKNNQKFLFLNDTTDYAKQKLLDEFLSQLHLFNKNLFFIIGGDPNNSKMELIITADGIVEYFQNVEDLVKMAPTLKDWKITAFKPAMGPGFRTEFRGHEFDPEKIIFIPLNNKQNPQAVGLHICYPDYSKEQREIFVQGTDIMIDALIGEKATALDIHYMDVIGTPENISDYNFKHLSELQDFINEKKQA